MNNFAKIFCHDNFFPTKSARYLEFLLMYFRKHRGRPEFRTLVFISLICMLRQCSRVHQRWPTWGTPLCRSCHFLSRSQLYCDHPGLYYPSPGALYSVSFDPWVQHEEKEEQGKQITRHVFLASSLLHWEQGRHCSTQCWQVHFLPEEHDIQMIHLGISFLTSQDFLGL